MGNLSGERKGKQAFASINYRTKDKYGILNVTPTGKLTYGGQGCLSLLIF